MRVSGNWPDFLVSEPENHPRRWTPLDLGDQIQVHLTEQIRLNKVQPDATVGVPCNASFYAPSSAVSMQPVSCAGPPINSQQRIRDARNLILPTTWTNLEELQVRPQPWPAPWFPPWQTFGWPRPRRLTHRNCKMINCVKVAAFVAICYVAIEIESIFFLPFFPFLLPFFLLSISWMPSPIITHHAETTPRMDFPLCSL